VEAYDNQNWNCIKSLKRFFRIQVHIKMIYNLEKKFKTLPVSHLEMINFIQLKDLSLLKTIIQDLDNIYLQEVAKSAEITLPNYKNSALKKKKDKLYKNLQFLHPDTCHQQSRQDIRLCTIQAQSIKIQCLHYRCS
jgi:hypothetical protein